MTQTNDPKVSQNKATLDSERSQASVIDTFIQQSKDVLYVHCQSNGEIVNMNRGFRKRFHLPPDSTSNNFFSFLSFNSKDEVNFLIGLEESEGQPVLMTDVITNQLLLFYVFQRNNEFFLFSVMGELKDSEQTELLSSLTTTMGNLLREESRAHRKLAEAYKEIEKLSRTDALTNLANHGYFMQRSEEILNHAKRHNRSVCIVMSDIDHFKKVNDKFGHQTGDKVLAFIGDLLNNSTRAGDISARYGGEEFVTVLQDSSLEEAGVFAERIRATFEESCPLGVEDPITISLGVAKFDAEETLESLIKSADGALYEAKATGRNKVCFAG